MRRAIIVSFLLLGSAANAQSDVCGMSSAFSQPDDGGKKSVAVWSDKSGKALLFADTMNINTDGTRRSYSVDDFWGEKTALNNLCNAMSDGCAGLTSDQLRTRRIATQQAKVNGWPAAQIAATKISPSIISFKNGKPCPEVDGYLVSATTLHKAGISNVCDILNYTDALAVPAIVLPKRASKGVATPFESRGAQIGDLVVTMSGDGKLIRYAVAGDMGPSKSLGEISLALAADLIGKTSSPANYLEVRGKKPYQGKGWHVGKTFTLIFPRTKNSAEPYMTRERIERDAAAAFQQWGGEKRLRACSAVYKPG
ncbi:glycoside hydrolase family 75 protein [Novosphingobium sp. 9U]|uniref:glycoside hydrolase family 75 protein n=1 Tax=Novosphingobium sp. 9U TaxID=2653158 RepID=UPI0012F20387|nr:glycoside hydrolase family 75 protein [Novosphingobium sp. 9U]VWX51781.1 Fungal chitosanase [Novosphingobium sp. 9U]